MSDAYGAIFLSPGEMKGDMALFTSQVNSTSGRKVAFAFQVPKAITISKVQFRYGARTGTPPTYICGLQGLDSSGNPDGTYKGGGSPASATFTPPADTTWNSTIREITLANSYAASAGEFLALVIEYSSGTVDASNNSSFTLGLQNPEGQNTGFPYCLENTGSWSKRTPEKPIFGISNGTTVYGFPVQTMNGSGIATAGHRVALRGLLASGWGSTYKVRGIRFLGRFGVVGVTHKIGIWEGTTEKAALTFDSDFRAATSGDTSIYTYLFDSPVSLNYGTAYYFGIENVGGGSTLFVADFQVGATDQLQALPGGAEFYRSTYNGSAWTDENTKRPLISLIMDDITKPVAGPSTRSHQISSGVSCG